MHRLRDSRGVLCPPEKQLVDILVFLCPGLHSAVPLGRCRDNPFPKELFLYNLHSSPCPQTSPDYSVWHSGCPHLHTCVRLRPGCHNSLRCALLSQQVFIWPAALGWPLHLCTVDVHGKTEYNCTNGETEEGIVKGRDLFKSSQQIRDEHGTRTQDSQAPPLPGFLLLCSINLFL